MEYFEADNNPEDENSGKHTMAFTKEVYIEREDFMEVPVKGYHRLYPGNEIRLKGAYYIKAVSIDILQLSTAPTTQKAVEERLQMEERSREQATGSALYITLRLRSGSTISSSRQRFLEKLQVTTWTTSIQTPSSSSRKHMWRRKPERQRWESDYPFPSLFSPWQQGDFILPKGIKHIM